MKTKKFFFVKVFFLWSTLIFTLSFGCITPKPDLGILYNQEAKDVHHNRNPVIIIPGILGSKLVDQDSKRNVWGVFDRHFANPDTSAGAQLIALPMKQGVPLKGLRDSIQARDILDRIDIDWLGLPIHIRAYGQILRILGVGGYRNERLGRLGNVDYGPGHYTCFQFHYDWRRDLVENAKRLHEFILEKRAYVMAAREKELGIKPKNVQFDLVAHSMGGLVARYYLRYGNADLPSDSSLPQLTWMGARYVEKAILVGTPNAGSLQALVDLIEGQDFHSLVFQYKPGILGTFPSLYQVLPRNRHHPLVDSVDQKTPVGDLLDVSLWQGMKWGLANPKEDKTLKMLLPKVRDQKKRKQIALDHLRKSLQKAKQFQAALDIPARRPKGLDLYLFLGDAKPTPSVLSVNRQTGHLKVTAWAPGDEVVLRSSALMDERIGGSWHNFLTSPIDWTDVNFYYTNHLGLTEDPTFTDKLLYLLLEEPKADVF